MKHSTFPFFETSFNFFFKIINFLHDSFLKYVFFYIVFQLCRVIRKYVCLNDWNSLSCDNMYSMYYVCNCFEKNRTWGSKELIIIRYKSTNIIFLGSSMASNRTWTSSPCRRLRSFSGSSFGPPEGRTSRCANTWYGQILVTSQSTFWGK